jgi:flagellar protein FliL
VAEELKASSPQVEGQSTKRKSCVTWIWITLLVFLAGSALIARSLFPKTTGHADTGETRRIKSTLHLETFVINLVEPEDKAYLRVGIDLGLDRELPGKDGPNTPSIAQVRDTVIDVLAASHAQDLLTPEGKKKLKEQTLTALQQRIPELGAREVYFTEFLIQR